MRLAAPPASNSVAVLYFATRDTTDLYLAEGLTEDIATGLGRLAPRVEVKAPSSVRRAQRVSPGDLRGIGRALGVHYLVDGGLRRTPSGYRVSVRLVNTQNELTTWGQTYDQSSTGLLDLPATVAQAVAEAITGALAPAERTSLAARPTRDPAAWEHVLRGNFFLARRTQEDAQRAVNEYQEAIRLDSSYVDAYGALVLDWVLWLTKSFLNVYTSPAAAETEPLDVTVNVLLNTLVVGSVIHAPLLTTALLNVATLWMRFTVP